MALDNAFVRYQVYRHPLHFQGDGYAGQAVDCCHHIPRVRSHWNTDPVLAGRRMRLGFPRDLEEDIAHSRSRHNCRRANHHSHLARAIAQS